MLSLLGLVHLRIPPLSARCRWLTHLVRRSAAGGRCPHRSYPFGLRLSMVPSSSRRASRAYAR